VSSREHCRLFLILAHVSDWVSGFKMNVWHVTKSLSIAFGGPEMCACAVTSCCLSNRPQKVVGTATSWRYNIALPAYTHMTHRFCESNGLTEVTGDCLAGYYCTSGAILRNPVDQPYGDLCTAGHYCEEGSAWPQPCPPGTYYGAEVFFVEYRHSV